MSSSAVQRILELKQRPIDKGLIVIAADFSQIEVFLDFPNDAIKELVLASWPGPVTWIVPVKPDVPYWLTGEHTGLAVRVSAHPLVQELCRLTGPLVSTSANPAGSDPAKTTSEVQSYFGDKLDYVLAGQLGTLDKPTQIKDALTGSTLR